MLTKSIDGNIISTDLPLTVKGGDKVTANLVAELIKKGVPANQVSKEIAETIGVTERTARNKINGKTGFTVPEAVKINDVWFSGEQQLDYLFMELPIIRPA